MPASNEYSLNCKGKLLDLSTPAVMGILNVTPDSFYSESRKESLNEIVATADKMLSDGASILDVGGQSTRPGAAEVGVEKELERVIPAIEAILDAFPEAVISIDTYHASVAETAIRSGASIINDISGGTYDDLMLPTVGQLKVPYILMHTPGRYETMQQDPHYENVSGSVIHFLSKTIAQLHELGVNDIVIDPGFGFGKSLEHNYMLLNDLPLFHALNKPLLVGISRKSMINNVLTTSSLDALNGTTVLNTMLLERGAHILRVHDVKEAVEAVKIFSFAATVRN